MPEISIIVPVYRTEELLHRCVRSLLGQTFTDIEILLVDDGSPDACGGICDDYARKDPRVKTIHQENRGLSAARNAGIEAADAPYIGFVDSDDWVHPEMYETLHRHIKEHDADIASCEFRRISRESPPPNHFGKAIVRSGKDELSLILRSKLSAGHTAWNRLYRAGLFQNIRFPEGKLYEDAFTVYKLYYCSDRVVSYSGVLYYYWQRPDSIAFRKFDERSMDKLEAAESVLAFVMERCPEFEKQALCFRTVSALRLMADLLEAGRDCYPDEFSKVMQILNSKGTMRNPCLAYRHKLLLLLLRISPRLYRRAWKKRLSGNSRENKPPKKKGALIR